MAEANAGSQRCGKRCGGQGAERARVMAEHGVVAGSGCIASVGGGVLGTRRRNAMAAEMLAAER